MATFNMCNQFDQKTDSTTVMIGTVHTEYEDLPQPKPAEKEKESFSAKSLFGKVLGGIAVVACAAAVVGLAAAYVASVVVTGGASLAAAPLLVTGTAFLLTSGFAAYSGASALNAQYQSDLANQEDSGWGAYVGAPALETVKTGARDLAWQMVIPVAGKAAGPVISKYGGQLFGKLFKAKEFGTFKITNWNNYPKNIPKPKGPFRIVTGSEYEAARKAANNANRAMHKADPLLKGKQIHEIQPVKFGGSPTDPANKIPLTPAEHAKATTWWRRTQQNMGNK